jgi:transcriptional regulator GlxA family with amidase domain
MTRSVAFLLVPEFQLLDMAGPLSVFQVAGEMGRNRRGPAYETALLSERGGRVACSAGVEMQTRAWRGSQAGTLVVPGGWGARQPGAAAARRQRLFGRLCPGRGGPAGRQARHHPLEPDQDFQRAIRPSGWSPTASSSRTASMWSSAGITAGIDLSLALIGADEGEAWPVARPSSWSSITTAPAASRSSRP